MPSRFSAHVEASGLLRRAESQGGFGTILKRGDQERGTIVLHVTRRGEHHCFVERTLGGNGSYSWVRAGPAAGADPPLLADWSQKRVRFDEDLWLIELDVPDPERFIAELASEG
jgi:hypothetical protein